MQSELHTLLLVVWAFDDFHNKAHLLISFTFHTQN